MSLYLWHLTALILVTVVEHAAGLDRVAPHQPHFWLSTVVQLSVLIVVVIALVSVTAPLERVPVPWLEQVQLAASDTRWRTAAAVVGVVLCGVGFLVLAGTGMQGFPFGRVTRYAGLKLTPGLGMTLLTIGAVAARFGWTTARHTRAFVGGASKPCPTPPGHPKPLRT